MLEWTQAGRVWVRGVLSTKDLAQLAQHCDAAGAPGARLALTDEFRRDLAVILDPMAAALLPGAFPVRAVAFDKSETNNWSLGWHQDRVIAAKGRTDVDGFSNWSRKGEVWHVEPPIDVLEEMIFARVHFDAVDAENGGMEIALGSHALGKVEASQAAAHAQSFPVELCAAEPGDVLISRFLMLHRSAPSRSTQHRRALRLDYRARRLGPPFD